MEGVTLGAGFGEWVKAPSWNLVTRGVAPSGPQDRSSALMANAIVGNSADTAVLEMLLWPPKVTFEKAGVITITGAEVVGTLNEVPVSSLALIKVSEGDVLSLQLSGAGSRVYVAFNDQFQHGSFDVKSSYLKLRRLLPKLSDLTPIRVVKGRDFEASLWRENGGFESLKWRVSKDLNNMGVRLMLPEQRSLNSDGFDRPSAPTQDGLIQLTPSGLIALLRGRGTIGGYPQLGCVLGAEVDRLAQLRPGNSVRFQWVSDEEAETIQGRYEQWCESVQLTLPPL